MTQDGKSGDLYRYSCTKCERLFLSNKKEEAISRRDKHELTCRFKKKPKGEKDANQKSSG